jgi:sensor histidine kinase regulating citrate/malate metabolism
VRDRTLLVTDSVVLFVSVLRRRHVCEHVGMPVGARRGRWGLARQLLVLQVIVVVLIVGIGAGVSVGSAQRSATDASRAEVLAMAETLAQSPGVISALRSADPTKVLQPEAEAVMGRTDTSFIVFMSPSGIRYSHPNPAQIGQHYIGDIGPAQHGQALTETYQGTLGLSVRSVAPVFAGGKVIGLVSVGVLVQQISAEVSRQLPGLLGLAALALAVGTIGSLLLARRVRRQTLGLDPAAIARQYQHHDAMLHAVQEGLLITDRAGKLVLANDEAHRLLRLPAGGVGRPLAELVEDTELADVLGGQEPIRDRLCVTADRVLLASRSPAEVDGRGIGAVTTLRDRTELQTVLRELDTVRALADSLRAQAHESANRLQALVGLVELGRHEDAVRLGTRGASVAQELSDQLIDQVGEPALVALLLGKTSTASERGVELRLAVESQDGAVARLPVEDVLTVVGNLLDNAIDAAAGAGSGWVSLTLRETDAGELLVRVSDSGPGIPAGHLDDLFRAGWTTKPDGPVGGRGLGLALVRQAVHRLGGTITVANGGAADGSGAVFEAHLPAAERTGAGT